MSQSDRLAQIIVQGMQEKKAQDVIIVDLTDIPNPIADYIVICSGSSDTQVDSIAASVDEEVSKVLGENPIHVEGKTNKEWVLIDYTDVVAHVFQKNVRQFYDLEGLWGDAKIIKIED